MENEAAVEQKERSAASQRTFRRWLEEVSPNIVIGAVPSLVGAMLAVLIGGVFMMLDSQFEIFYGELDAMDGQLDSMHGKVDALDGKVNTLHQKVDTVDKKLDESLDKLATQDDVGNLDRRLLGIEEYLRGGTGGPPD